MYKCCVCFILITLIIARPHFLEQKSRTETWSVEARWHWNNSFELQPAKISWQFNCFSPQPTKKCATFPLLFDLFLSLMMICDCFLFPINTRPQNNWECGETSAAAEWSPAWPGGTGGHQAGQQGGEPQVILASYWSSYSQYWPLIGHNTRLSLVNILLILASHWSIISGGCCWAPRSRRPGDCLTGGSTDTPWTSQ